MVLCHRPSHLKRLRIVGGRSKRRISSNIVILPYFLKTQTCIEITYNTFSTDIRISKYYFLTRLCVHVCHSISKSLPHSIS
jgi:hypothetical protein